MERVILHCDCNSYYASVECLLRPELKTVPMAVAGDPESRHGIILAKNELAKAAGVQTAEPIWQARRKCPGLVLVSPHHDKYKEVSKKVNRIYQAYTELVEPFGIDESFLDVTGSLKLFQTTPRELADTLRRRVREEIGLTISVGVSFNKAFAKLGSDYKKPDATTVIFREDVPRIVWPLPVSDLLYVGHRSAELLEQRGIRTIGQLAAADRVALSELLGKSGDLLWRYANGLDRERVRSVYEKQTVKSVGNGITFPRDLTTERELRAGAAMLADSVAMRLRAKGLKCTVLQIQIKNPALKTISRQKALGRATWSQRELTEAAMELIRSNWKIGAPVRMLTITGQELVDAAAAPTQENLFAPPPDPAVEKHDRVEDAMAAIREKFGKDSIHTGGTGAKRQEGEKQP